MSVPEPNSLQYVSSMCMVCGEDNAFSLKAQFINKDAETVEGIFFPLPEHQSYPGRVHGGIISAALDEALGRVVQLDDINAFGVTTELRAKFRKPVPVDRPFKIIARRIKDSSLTFEAEGELMIKTSADSTDYDTVAATSWVRYAKVDITKIADGGLNHKDWHPDQRQSLIN